MAAVNIDFGEFNRSKEWIDKGLKNVEHWGKLRQGDSQPQSFHATLLHLRGVSLEQRRQLVEARGFYTDALKIRRKLLTLPEADRVVQGKWITQANCLNALKSIDIL
jgi:hypothetical protein